MGGGARARSDTSMYSTGGWGHPALLHSPGGVARRGGGTAAERGSGQCLARSLPTGIASGDCVPRGVGQRLAGSAYVTHSTDRSRSFHSAADFIATSPVLNRDTPDRNALAAVCSGCRRSLLRPLMTWPGAGSRHQPVPAGSSPKDPRAAGAHSCWVRPHRVSGSR